MPIKPFEDASTDNAFDQAITDINKVTNTSKTLKKGNFNQQNLAYLLGQAGQAVMGSYKDSPFAQLGALGSQIAQQKSFSETVAGLLAGEDISKLNTSILTPDQVTQAMDIKKRADESMFSKTDLYLKRVDQIAKSAMNEDQKKIAYAQLENDMKIAGVQTEAQKDIAKTNAAADITTTAMRNQSTEEVAKIQTSADKEITVMNNETRERISKIDARAAFDRIQASIKSDDLRAAMAYFADMGDSIGMFAVLERLYGTAQANKMMEGTSVNSNDDLLNYMPESAKARIGGK